MCDFIVISEEDARVSVEKIKYADRIIPQIGGKNIIIHNVNNNKTAKITKEAYDVVDHICRFGWNVEDVLNSCETQEDRVYLLKNLTCLAENSIIREINDFSEYKEMDIRIDWDITNRCNLRCKHCCVSADIRNKDLGNEALTEVVNQLVSLHPAAVTISGGEPLIREDFRDIISKLKKNYQGSLHLMTNAVLIDDKMARFISDNFSSVSVSLDGVDEETCSAVRGKGVFAKTISGIQHLQAAGMTRISASMVVTKATYRYKTRFMDMCREMNVEPFLRSLSLVGRAEEEMKDMIPDAKDELEWWKQESERKEQEHKGPEKAKTGIVPMFSCGAAYKQFQIDYRGNIYPCQSLMEEEFLLGNVLEVQNLNEYIRDRLFTTTEGYKRLEQFFPYNFSECKGCNKQIFCWNCVETIYRQRSKREDCSITSCMLDRYWE